MCQNPLRVLQESMNLIGSNTSFENDLDIAGYFKHESKLCFAIC